MPRGGHPVITADDVTARLDMWPKKWWGKQLDAAIAVRPCKDKAQSALFGPLRAIGKGMRLSQLDNEQLKKMQEEPLPVYLVIYGEKAAPAHTETSP